MAGREVSRIVQAVASAPPSVPLHVRLSRRFTSRPSFYFPLLSLPLSLSLSLCRTHAAVHDTCVRSHVRRARLGTALPTRLVSCMQFVLRCLKKKIKISKKVRKSIEINIT